MVIKMLKELSLNGFVKVPDYVKGGLLYETKMGSQAYGCSEDSSDCDVYGFFIPPLEDTFPHLRGDFNSFSEYQPLIEVFQAHHIQMEHTQYDFSVYSIIKYFQLCSQCNPNMQDSLFTYDCDLLTQTKVSKMVRDNRQLFLSKLSYRKFLGYSRGQIDKMKAKKGHENPKRNQSIVKHGYDVKYAYHCIRLLLESLQILQEGTMDLKKNSQLLNDIRNGLYSVDDIEKMVSNGEGKLSSAYENSKLRDSPDMNGLKKLLLNCYEEHYGKLSWFVGERL